MKPSLIAAITVGIAIAIVATVFSYQQIYNENCATEGKKITGFLQCTEAFNDFATQFDNLSESEIESVLVSPQKREEALNLLMWLYENERKPFMKVMIVGLNQTYIKGDQISFTAIEAGVDNNSCTNSRFIITNKDTHKIHSDWTEFDMCPAPRDEYYSILNYINMPKYGWDIPPITQSGTYTLRVESNHDSFDQKEFTILDSDYVFERKVVYRLVNDNLSSQTVTIDLETGEIESKTFHGTFHNKLAKNRLAELNSIIEKNKIVGMIPIGYAITEQSHIRIDLYIGTTRVNYVTWQHEYMRDSPIDEPMEVVYAEYFDYVEKIAHENGIPKGGPLVR